jgi:hypothetical protein
MVLETGGTEHDVIVDMPLVYVRGQDVLVSALQDLIGKALANLVCLLWRCLSRLEGLYQMMGEVIAFGESF